MEYIDGWWCLLSVVIIYCDIWLDLQSTHPKCWTVLNIPSCWQHIYSMSVGMFWGFFIWIFPGILDIANNLSASSRMARPWACRRDDLGPQGAQSPVFACASQGRAKAAEAPTWRGTCKELSCLGAEQSWTCWASGKNWLTSKLDPFRMDLDEPMLGIGAKILIQPYSDPQAGRG